MRNSNHKKINKPSISVIVPAYNEEKYLSSCLKSIKNQTIKPLEIIVVDNNSTDKTVQIAKKYGVTLLKALKQGQSHARNCGFNAARGDILARCDADVVVPPDWLEKIRANFIQNNIDALTGPVHFDDISINVGIITQIYFFVTKILIKKNEVLLGPNMIITKNVWNKIRVDICTDDHNIHEDVDVSIHISRVGGIIARDNSLVVNTSARRITKTPITFFIGYPIKMVKTVLRHLF